MNKSMDELTYMALLVAVLAAAQTLLMKHLTTNHNSQTVFALFSLIYFALTLFYIRHHFDVISASMTKMTGPVFMLIVLAVLLAFFSNSIYHSLLSKHEASVVSALVSVTPVFIVLFTLFVIKKPITNQQILGIATVVGGVVLLS
jgi:drug/metabolite transporter (DMT)-like permease